MKYHNRKVVTDTDGTFDSAKEFNRWVYLKNRQERGEIEDLKRQVKYVLIPTQRVNGKIKERELAYVADFVYVEDGVMIVEDVKPTDRNGKVSAYYKTTAAYKAYTIKRKLMLWKYGIEVKEV